MFRFIHTADWQIGKTFGGFAPDKRSVLREARLAAVDRIAEAARGHGASDVLVAGDVFDQETLSSGETRRLLERLASAAPLRWHLLPGNHDPGRPGGIYERLLRGGIPEAVLVHREARAVEIAPGVALLPAPLTARAVTADPTLWMDAAPTAPGTLRIGLAHGSVQAFGTSSDSAARLSPERRRTAGLAYLALGDWHGTKEVAEGVWYSGTPEPDRYLDNDAGQVLAVTVGGPAGLAVRPVPTAAYRWVGRELPVRSEADAVALERVLGGGLDRVLLKLHVAGRVSIGTHGAVLAHLMALGERLFHLDLDREAFEVAPAGDEVASLGVESGLSRVADRLVALRDAGQTPAAERALEILFRLAAGAAP
ncbi:MAG: DNA repair exonuclease [Hyphomicrobiaceae bacterium]